jgi:hypothetical protein
MTIAAERDPPPTIRSRWCAENDPMLDEGVVREIALP